MEWTGAGSVNSIKMKTNQTRVIVGSEGIAFLQNYLAEKKFGKVILVVDSNTGKYCLPLFLKNFPALENSLVYSLPAGEKAKAPEPFFELLSFLTGHDVTVNSLVISLGGGAVSDVAGFAASVYKRGISLIHVPTSLIAMVDAAYGGKTGINFKGVKNNIGTFYFPHAVFIFHEFLKTLPVQHIRSGFGEMLKYALLIGEKTFDEVLGCIQNNRLPDDEMIYQCLRYKMEVVELDPFEKHQRVYLNLGHTLGHAFESAAMERGNAVEHGLAVAAGIYYALSISVKRSGFPAAKAKELQEFIRSSFSMEWLRDLNRESIRKYMVQDKKKQGEGIRMVLLKEIGEPVVVNHIPPDEVLSILS